MAAKRELHTLYLPMERDSPLKLEHAEGARPGTQIVRLSGPLTLANIFDFQREMRAGELPSVRILDLSQVPYMDSAGLGAVVNCHTHSQNRGARLIVAGTSERVFALFRSTRIDSVLTMAPSVAEAEALA